MRNDRLRSLREKKGLSQTEAAKRLGMVRTTYSNYEAGNREPDNESLKKLAEFYEVSVDYLLGIEKPSGETRDYDPFLMAIKEKYPDVNIDDPDIRRKLMKAIDLVLEDYQQKQ